MEGEKESRGILDGTRGQKGVQFWILVLSSVLAWRGRERGLFSLVTKSAPQARKHVSPRVGTFFLLVRINSGVFTKGDGPTMVPREPGFWEVTIQEDRVVVDRDSFFWERNFFMLLQEPREFTAVDPLPTRVLRTRPRTTRPRKRGH